MKKKDSRGNFSVTVRKGGRVFWGVLFLLGAVAFPVSRLGLFEGIGLGSILISIGLLAILINSLAKQSFGGILFSLALLVIVNDEFLRLEAITPWPVLGAALLGTIGLNLLFPKPPRARREKAYRSGSREHISEDAISYENAFGGVVKYVVGEVSQVNLDNAFGFMEVYFSDAVLKDHMAHVNVDSVFGKVALYVPRSWKVVGNNMEQLLGDVCPDQGSDAMEEDGAANKDNDILHITGDVSFGALVIHSI